MDKFMVAILRIAVALWFGGVSLFTFVLTPLIFKNETRDVAGGIVGYLFPGYFRWGIGCGVVALVALLILGQAVQRSRLAVLLVTMMLIITAIQTWYIEPQAAAIKRQIPSFTTTPKDHPLRRQFSKLHGISAASNLSVFAGGFVLVVLL
ncbi:MAG: DUF4149 domain-containing protein [Desulfobulbaceae bacterium]|nr:DUF4149 domain-containing protein [Desulfobulbaceae bacterium]